MICYSRCPISPNRPASYSLSQRNAQSPKQSHTSAISDRAAENVDNVRDTCATGDAEVRHTASSRDTSGLDT